VNPISSTVAAFTRSIDCPRFAAELSRARAACPSLAAYATPAELLAALAVSSPLPREQQDALLLAIVAEHQRARHELWQSILLATYEGMLHNVARRTLGVSRDDARQGALSGFLSAIASMKLEPPPQRPSLRLRQDTERAAFAQACFTEEPDAEPLRRRERDPHSLEDSLQLDDQMDRLVRELVRLFGDGTAVHEVLDVLLYSRTGNGQLTEYVDEKYVGLTLAQRDRIYERLKEMRARALARLEKVFGGDYGIDAVVHAA
jgi:hypothetical protein